MEWLVSLFLLSLILHTWTLRTLAKGCQKKTPIRTESLPPVSVIIAARNEAPNLEACLAAVFQNEYPANWEVVLVNDRSTDATLEIAREWESRHLNLKVVSVDSCPKEFPPKKYALTQGIQHATHEHLLFTDADCRVPTDWLLKMGGAFGDNTEVVLGSGPYFRKPGLLNGLIQYETLQTAFLYLGMAGNGNPYMGIGRNLAYRKSFFERANGFQSSLQSLSGDDDLLVNHHASGLKTRILREAPVYSEPTLTWKAWISQKMRHLSAGKFYRPETMLLPGLFQATWGLTLLTGLTISWFQPLPLLLIIWAFALFRLDLMRRAVKFHPIFTREFVILPLLECLFALYQLVIGPAGMIFKPKWTSSRPHPQEQKKTGF